ncbi:MAG: ankyrin repeat domain-containing protein [Alphaproteobacteria bacterium]|nr:ankyrin repeat domain-containing protein [Alphaproteobacteria bacterium]
MNPRPDETEIYIFSMAASDGKENYVREFLDKYPGGADLRNQFGGTALNYAALRGQMGIVELLIEKGASIDLPDNNGDTPLMCAAIKGHRELVLRLLEKGASFDKTNHEGKTALILAEDREQAETAALILRHAEANLKKQATMRLEKLKTRRPPQSPFKKGPK